MAKITRQPHIDKTAGRPQLVQELSNQWILSPFVHAFNINESTKCLFNSLTLKKIYLDSEKYAKLIADLNTTQPNAEVKSLIDLKFLVPKGFDPKRVFDSLAGSLLRKEPCPSIDRKSVV